MLRAPSVAHSKRRNVVPPANFVPSITGGSSVAERSWRGCAGLRLAASLRVDIRAHDDRRTSALGWPRVASGYAARRVYW